MHGGDDEAGLFDKEGAYSVFYRETRSCNIEAAITYKHLNFAGGHTETSFFPHGKEGGEL